MRKRSRYRPKLVVFDNMGLVKAKIDDENIGKLPLSTAEEELRKLRCANHGALTDVVQGKGTKASAVMLRNMLITAESIAQLGAGIDWLDELHQAQAAVDALVLRGIRTGRYVFTGVELNAANVAMELHELQLDSITLKQFEDAIVRAKRQRGIA